MKNKYIDLKQLSNLVPQEYAHKINLLFKKDIPKNPTKASELIIYKLSKLKETHIQQYFHRQFNILACEMKARNEHNELWFVQNDNGDTAGGSLTQGQRISLYKRKKAEGSKKGFPDISMYVYSAKINLRDTFFCETKKIGTPSEIHISLEQLEWFIRLNEMGYNAYITNNPLFFENVVLSEIKELF